MAKIQRSIKLEADTERRVLSAIAATGTEHSFSGVVEIALRQFLAGLYINPSMLEGYDPKLDKSVAQKRKGKYELDI